MRVGDLESGALHITLGAPLRGVGSVQIAAFDQTPAVQGTSMTRVWFAAFTCAALAALLKWPLLIYPSVDDLQFIQSSMHEGGWLTITRSHLGWGRVLPLPIFAAGRAVGVPDFVTGQVFFLPTELVYAAVAVFTLHRLRPLTSPWVLGLAAFAATLNPGFIELGSFAVARIDVCMSLAAMLAFIIFSDPRRARPFFIWTALTALAVMCSYQGGMNLFFLLVVVVLVAAYLNSPEFTFLSMARAMMCAVFGLLLAAVLDLAIMRAMAYLFELRSFFQPIPFAQIWAKLEVMLHRFPDKWSGAASDPSIVFGRRTVMLLVLVGAPVMGLWARTIGRRQILAASIIGLTTLVVSMQPLSLPFNYDWFPPRTAFWLYLAVLAVVVPMLGCEPLPYRVRMVWLSVAGCATFIVVSQGMAISFSYAKLRQNDMAIAREVVGRLEQSGFNWRETPVYIELGPWPHPPAFLTNPGTPGDMISLLATRWSRLPLLGMAAGAQLKSPEEGEAAAAKLCSSMAPNPVRYRLLIEPSRAVVCL